MYWRRSKNPENRLGITVSTKVGCAVVRNRVRRRIREAYRINEARFKDSLDIVIVARVRAASVSYSEIEKNLLSLGKGLGLLSEVQE